MLQHLDPTVFNEKKCMWVDFCVMSSTTTNSTIDQNVIASWVNDSEMVKDYYRRLSIYLCQQNDDRMPCVYIAGKTCQQTFDKAVEFGLVKRIDTLSLSNDIHLCEMNGIKFITLEERPHPSYHLMKGNAQESREVFKESMQILNAIGGCSIEERITADQIEKSVMNELAVDLEQFKMRDQGRVFMTQILYNGDSSGRFHSKHKHLRHVKAHIPAIQDLLIRWRDKYGMDLVWRILLSSDLYYDLLRHEAMLDYWICTLGPKHFVTFISGSVACRLYDDRFLFMLDYWLRTLGADRFVTFMCGGTAIAFENDDAYERLLKLHQLIGYGIHTFMKSGIGTHLQCEETFNELVIWLARFGGKLFVQAFCRPMVVSRVVKANQFGLLEQLYNECNQNAIILYSNLFMNKARVFCQHFPLEKVGLIESHSLRKRHL